MLAGENSHHGVSQQPPFLLTTASICKRFEIPSLEQFWGLKEERIEWALKNHPSLPTKEDIFEQLAKISLLIKNDSLKQTIDILEREANKYLKKNNYD